MAITEHMRKIIEREENRIRAELLGMLVDAFLKADLFVTISHDHNNETERRVKSAKAANRYAFYTDVDGDGPYFWVFAYTPEQYVRNEKPLHWVKCVPVNVQDLISDFNTGAKDIVKPIYEHSNKYD